MTNIEFINKAKQIASEKTLYVSGGFGQRLSASEKQRFIANYKNNQNANRKAKINTSLENVRAWDCIGLVKGILWGYPNTKYKSNNVPDIGENALITMCKPSKDFSQLVEGAVVWMNGHIGIYIGNNLVIESTPSWKDGVQITGLGNNGYVPNYPNRAWQMWGKLPYITYEETEMVKQIEVISNGKKCVVDAITKDGTNYIKLRDLDDKLGIAKVNYDAAKRLPVIDKI